MSVHAEEMMPRFPTLFSVLLATFTAACAADQVASVANCTGAKTYTVGSSATGTTGVGNCKGPDGSPGQLYTMTLTQQSNMLFTVTATGFSANIKLYNAAGDAVGVNSPDSKFKVFLPAGIYSILINSLNGQDGAYTLTSSPASLDGCSGSTVSSFDLGVTTKGASISGTITASDCGNLLSKSDIYELPLAAGASASVSITVDRVAGLAITSGTGTVLSKQEMMAAGTWNTTVTATATGRYQIHVESRTANGSANLPVAYSILIN